MRHESHEQYRYGGGARQMRERSRGFDRGYRQWRSEQLGALDAGCQAWREERYKEFANELSRFGRSRPGEEGKGSEKKTQTKTDNGLMVFEMLESFLVQAFFMRDLSSLDVNALAPASLEWLCIVMRVRGVPSSGGLGAGGQERLGPVKRAPPDLRRQ